MAIVFKSVHDYGGGGGGNVELDMNIPHMTSNTTPSGVASASSQSSADYAPWKAMQGGYDTGGKDRWAAPGENNYIQYEFTEAIKPYLIQFKSRPTSRKAYDTPIACSIQVLGSDDGTNFDLIDTLQVDTDNADDVVNYFVNTNSYYSYFRLQFVGYSVLYNNAKYCGLSCLQIIGETDKSTLPDGKTVTPINDVATWLLCANIEDKEYTSITEVLADTVTLSKLIKKNNAADYLKRSTDFITEICANSNAMTLIGANNYCANELLSDATWLQAICNSTYFESVLNVKVPIMTSNTAPSGEAFASSSYSSRPPYQAFNGRTTNFGTDSLSFWAPSNPNTANTAFIGYEFTQPVQIYKFKFCTLSGASSPSTQLYQLKGSNDGSNYEVIAEETATDISTNYSGSRYSFNISSNSNNKFKYITLTSVDYARSAGEVQFYGRA